MYDFWWKVHWNLLLRVHWTIFHHCFRKWLGVYQVTSHYLSESKLVKLRHKFPISLRCGHPVLATDILKAQKSAKHGNFCILLNGMPRILFIYKLNYQPQHITLHKIQLWFWTEELHKFFHYIDMDIGCSSLSSPHHDMSSLTTYICHYQCCHL